MADKNNESFWQMGEGAPTLSENEKDKEESLYGVPPPPDEVRIRTMKSDLESVVKSGGASPKFQKIKVVKTKPKKFGGFSWLWKVVVALISLVALFIGSYLIYDVFSESENGGSPSSGNEIGVLVDTGSPRGASVSVRVPEVVNEKSLVHSSLFSVPADTTLQFVVRGAAESAADLKTFSQSLTEVLVTAPSGADFIEVRMQDVDGGDLEAVEVLKTQNALFLPEDLLASKFSPDPTFFVYFADGVKDKNFFPGYVLALNPSENWLFLRDEVAKLELSNKITGLFLKNPGSRSQAGFIDISINGQQARKLEFSSGESFVYGWLRGHLILSSSEDGFREAISRL